MTRVRVRFWDGYRHGQLYRLTARVDGHQQLYFAGKDQGIWTSITPYQYLSSTFKRIYARKNILDSLTETIVCNPYL